MALIFIGSTDLMSAEHTSRFLEPFFHWLNPGISPVNLLKLEMLVRKGGHVSEYAVLALLMFRALANTALLRHAVFAMSLTLLASGAFAASDEFHQSFVPSRTSSARDVVIDLAGASLGIALYALSWWRRGPNALRQSQNRWA